jgi:hypothetical protein
MSAHYTVSDGELVLNMTPAEQGGYVVTSPADPKLVTQAETIEEAFAKARRDATRALDRNGAPPANPNTEMLGALRKIEEMRRGMSPKKDRADYLREAREGAMYGLGDN